MRILVTGTAGFIGMHVARRFLERGHQVLGIDSINDYYDPALKFSRLRQLGIGIEAETWGVRAVSTKFPGLSFIRTRLEDRSAMEAIFGLEGFDRVVNLAAQAGVRYSIDHPREYIDSNVVGFVNILEGCRHSKVPYLVYASSSSVYGLNDSRPFSTHENVDHPVSLYAATKKSGELMAHAYSHLYGLPTTGLRFFTVYGPWGRPDMAYFKFASAIREGRTIDIYNHGDMQRDFTYIDDIVDGVERVCESVPACDPSWNRQNPDPASSSAPYRIYNIGESQPVDLMEFVGMLEELLGMKAMKNLLPMQAGDVRATSADVSELYRDFGWRPGTALREGLRRFVEWFVAYERGSPATH